MTKKILILGASGFIGKHAVRKFLTSGYKVYAQYLPTENPPSIPEASWFPCDLRDQDFTKNFPQEVDAIIYLAQSPDYRSFPDGALDVFQVNVAAAFQAAEYARQAKAERLIFASTGSIYGQHTAPTREEDVRTENVTSFYAASKLAAELLLNQYHSILPVINLRLFIPYGEGQHEKMLISDLVNRVKENMPIDLDGSDGLVINPTAIADVAETLERCLGIGKSFTLNVAGPEMLSLRQIGEQIGLVLGKKPVFNCRSAETAPVIVGNTTRMKETLGWVPEIQFQSGLRQWLGK